MGGFTEANAVECEGRKALKAMIEAFIARYPVEMQDKAREAFRPALERIAGADDIADIALGHRR